MESGRSGVMSGSVTQVILKSSSHTCPILRRLALSREGTRTEVTKRLGDGDSNYSRWTGKLLRFGCRFPGNLLPRTGTVRRRPGPVTATGGYPLSFKENRVTLEKG